ncbi:MAG TPA: tetratricopeptide repeat protein [Chryseosolibacter sp.]|nr:tetratricopeptide repeat protein [Chryseosolibacter sp.]
MKKLFVPFLVCIHFFAFAQQEVDLYNRANIQFQYQNYDEAIALLTNAVIAKPDYADAFALRGDCYYYLKEYNTAIENYLKAEGLKKGRSSYNLACTYALSGNINDAFKYLETNLSSEYKLRLSQINVDPDLESLRKDPRWNGLVQKPWYTPYELALHEADDKINANDLAGSLASETQAISLNPNDDRAYGLRAILYIRSGEMQKALEDLNQAIRLKPQSVYYGNRGYVNNKLKNSEQTLADYEKAIALDPTNLVYYDLAMARFGAGKKAEALDALKKHTTYFTRDEMGYYFAGIVASQLNEFNEALSFLNKGIEINGSTYQLYMKRADTYFLMKRFEQAIADYDKVIELEPSFGEAYYIRGNAKGEMRDKDGACADWRKAVQLGFQDENGYIASICD